MRIVLRFLGLGDAEFFEIEIAFRDIAQVPRRHRTSDDGKELRNVAKGDLDLEKLGISKPEKTQDDAHAQESVAKLKEILGDRVKDVRVSARLKESPVCIVLDEHDMGLAMQRLLKQAGHAVPATKPILEINPSHPLIERLQTETDSERAKELGLMLLDQAQLLEGVALEDPAAYVRRVNALLVNR